MSPQTGAGENASGEPRWRRLEELFFELCDLPAEARDERLHELCAGEPELRDELLCLLNADAGGHSLLDDQTCLQPLAEGALRDPLLGAELGTYRLIERLGAGGMSTVYLAERIDGAFDRRCAVKVVRRGIDTEAVVERFAGERQILAQLSHPSITRLIDGGVTPDGRPYLVMDHVDGVAIDTYCARHELPVTTILELMIEICGAVEHAHRRLVVHRDIKPGNILVTADGSPRLLDFGVARLLDGHGDLGGSPTTVGSRFLTPEYASPEQIEGRQITTAIDVFSLGVLLYQLLTGHHPFTRPGRSRREIAAAVLGEEPPAPSRRAEPGRARRLRGDLDAIVQKAMSKDPEARYPSVTDLAEDLRRVLEARPVTARRGRLLYRARRWLRRHRLLATSTAAVVLTGTLGVVTVVEQRDRARVEQRRAEKVSELLIEILEAPDPTRRTVAAKVTAGQLVEHAASLLDQQLQDDPRLRGLFLLTLGRVVRNLGELDRARGLMLEALDTVEAETGGRTDPLRCELLFRLADIEIGSDRFDDAEKHLETLRGALGDNPGKAWRARLLGFRAMLEDARGNERQAGQLLERALPLIDAAMEPRLASWLLDLYARLQEAQTPEQAVRTAEQAWELAVAVFGPEHAISMDRRETVALTQWRAGRPDEARLGLHEVLRFRRRVFGDEHPSIASSAHHLGVVDRSTGQLQDAEAWFDEALAVAERSLGRASLHWAESAALQADVVRQQGDSARALELADEARPILAELLGEDHEQTRWAERLALGALLSLGRLDVAEERFAAALERLDAEAREPVGPRINLLHQGVELALARRDLPAVATRLGEADGLLAEIYPRGPMTRAFFDLLRARQAFLAGRPGDVGELLTSTAQRALELDPDRGSLFVSAQLDLAEWQLLHGHQQQAMAGATEAGQRATEIFGPGSPLAVRARLVTALASQRDADVEAELAALPVGERSPYLQAALETITASERPP